MLLLFGILWTEYITFLSFSNNRLCFDICGYCASGYHVQLFIQMTRISHAGWGFYYQLQRIKCVRWRVFVIVFVFQRLNTEISCWNVSWGRYLVWRKWERHVDEKNCTVRSCIICTVHWMLVGGELKYSGTGATREPHWRNRKYPENISWKLWKEKALWEI